MNTMVPKNIPEWQEENVKLSKRIIAQNTEIIQILTSIERMLQEAVGVIE